MGTLLRTTESLCPVCLTRIPASITADVDGVFLEKGCGAHGPFRTIIWRGSRPAYDAWIDDAGPAGRSHPAGPHRAWERGCPFNCGLCPDHTGESCSAALMVTSRCNLDCPVCFTRGKAEPLQEPSPAAIKETLTFYRETSGGPFPLELCGGEPTVRPDLPAIVSMARDMGFSSIQVNTNGIRLAEDPELAFRLKEAGATVIYLGFDGADDAAYRTTTGRNLFEIKVRVVSRCARVGLAVVLVPVLIPGVNTDQAGRIIELAKRWVPTVKGVHFQPVSYFGAYPNVPCDENRLTIPEILKMLAGQTRGEISESDFMPPGCEHPLCSFQALYMVGRDGRLKAVTKRHGRTDNDGATQRARAVTARQWRANPARTLTVGGMLFQDAWNIDLARLRRCIIHIITADRGLVPLCAKYLTAQDGRRLYPGLA